MTLPHIAVLQQEVLNALKGASMQYFVDGTLGAGGHAAAILQNHPEIKTYLGIDRDRDALHLAKGRLADWREKIALVEGNFSSVDTYCRQVGMERVDGILLDLGVSSMQLDWPQKGFSFSKEGPLDMRMGKQETLTAHEVVNTFSEQELGKIFRDLGEEKKWRLAARAIVNARSKEVITSTTQLAKIVESALPWKEKRGIHPATLVFQGLRIFVNRELEAIEEAIPKMMQLLSKGGRLLVISFHSLEDRAVKNAFRYAASDKENTTGLGGVFLSKQPTVRIVTRKPLVAGKEEVEENPRSRSAKLRVVEKL